VLRFSGATTRSVPEIGAQRVPEIVHSDRWSASVDRGSAGNELQARNRSVNEWLLYIMTYASQLSGYPLPDTLPTVQWQSESWFSHRVCRDHIPCPVFGMYQDGEVVYLRSDLTEQAKDHVAVHEFVHYLQHASGRFDLNSCIDSDAREQEAFRVQTRFVAEVQHGFTTFMIAHLPCERRE
jgi:hypothetical protein